MTEFNTGDIYVKVLSMEYDILQNCDKLCVSVRHFMGFSYTRFTNKGNMKNLEQMHFESHRDQCLVRCGDT